MSKHWLIFQSAVFAATFNKASQQTPFVSDNIIQLTDDDHVVFVQVFSVNVVK